MSNSVWKELRRKIWSSTQLNICGWLVTRMMTNLALINNYGHLQVLGYQKVSSISVELLSASWLITLPRSRKDTHTLLHMLFWCESSKGKSHMIWDSDEVVRFHLHSYKTLSMQIKRSLNFSLDVPLKDSNTENCPDWYLHLSVSLRSYTLAWWVLHNHHSSKAFRCWV